MKFDNIKELFDKENFSAWVNEHKRQVAVGCIAACLVIAAGASVISSSSSKKTENAAEGGSVMTSAVQDTEAAEKTALEEANQLEQDAYPEVNDLVQKYYDYMSAGDVDGLASVEDQISEEEQNRILRSKDLVEGYQNISCYTKKGLEDGSYLVFVYYELKFAQIDTPAPGLSPLYVYTNDEGNLVVFNGEARKLAYGLWLLVFLNFCVPTGLQSPFSLIPSRVETTAQNLENRSNELSGTIHQLSGTGLKSGMEAQFPEELQETQQNNLTGTETGISGQSKSTWNWSLMFRIVWLSGIVLLLIQKTVSTIKLKALLSKNRCVRSAPKQRIREYEKLPAPFVWGVLRPVICLPANLEATEKHYILAHENYHRKRLDPIWKLLFLLVRMLHQIPERALRPDG